MFAQFVLSCIIASSMLPAAVEADYVIRGATVYDGSAAEPRQVDVAIRGDRIAALGEVEAIGSPRVIRAEGLILAPGCIDLHSHSDRTIVRDATRSNLNYLKQGVTTIVTGNCGSGPVDVGEYFRKIDEAGAGTNVIHLIPHGSLRRQVLKSARRPPAPSELQQMQQLAREAMDNGAWGMSTGLIYVPSSYATTGELVDLMKVVGERGGFYATHMRNENVRLLESIEEALTIGRRSGAHVHISHFKVSGRHAWGIAPDAIELIKDARRQGQSVTADQYPYTASSTSLAAMAIPAAYRSSTALRRAKQDPDAWPGVRKQILKNLENRGNGASLFIASYSKHREWQGKNLAEIAQRQDQSVLDLVLEIQANGGASMVNFGMNEQEVRLIMQQDFVATASDGSAKDINSETVPHPRNYGCFPRKIGRYAISGKTISLPHAIRSCTSLPAEILQLPQRGLIQEGSCADLFVFDPDTYRDTATFDQPHQYATGVEYLFVNGQLTIDQGAYTGALAGKALRRNAGQSKPEP